jgi:hypothetical protein
VRLKQTVVMEKEFGLVRQKLLWMRVLLVSSLVRLVLNVRVEENLGLEPLELCFIEPGIS